jgi:hypothetical protein
VFERDGEASIMRRPWPTRGCCAMGEKYIYIVMVRSFRDILKGFTFDLSFEVGIV